MEIIIILLIYAGEFAAKIIMYLILFLIVLVYNLSIYIRYYICKIKKYMKENKKEKMITVNIYDKKHWRKFSKYYI